MSDRGAQAIVAQVIADQCMNGECRCFEYVGMPEACRRCDGHASVVLAALADAGWSVVPSPLPLVWRRLADEWPSEDRTVVWAWSPFRAEQGVRPAVVMATRLRFPNGEEWGCEGPGLKRGGCWLPAAVPTPPAPEQETKA